MGRRPELKSEDFSFVHKPFTRYRGVKTYSQQNKCYAYWELHSPRVGPMIRMALTHARCAAAGAWPRPFAPIVTATPGPRAERERVRSEKWSPGAASGRGYVLGAMVLLVFTVTL